MCSKTGNLGALVMCNSTGHQPIDDQLLNEMFLADIHRKSASGDTAGADRARRRLDTQHFIEDQWGHRR